MLPGEQAEIQHIAIVVFTVLARQIAGFLLLRGAEFSVLPVHGQRFHNITLMRILYFAALQGNDRIGIAVNVDDICHRPFAGFRCFQPERP